MPTLEQIEFIVVLLVTLVISLVLFGSDYLKGSSYRWLVLFALIIVGGGKLMDVKERMDKPTGSKLMTYWNIAFCALITIGTILCTFSNVDWENWGAYLIIITAVIDAGMIFYLDSPTKISLLLIGLGDILLIGSFALAVSNS